MPHTSHKKKWQQHQNQQSLPRNKRGEIKTDDGWTRISRSDKAVGSNTADKNRAQLHIYPPDDPNYQADQDEGSTKMIFHSHPASIPDGASLEKALSYYRACETTWKQSDSYVSLKETFDSRIDSKVLNAIDSCICFGLSSPTGILISGADRRNVSLYQLALFISVIDILTSKRGGGEGNKGPEAFAQEPIFNTLDIELLSHLGIKVVQHPAAFHLITSNTMAFCPGAEQDVARGTLHRSPAMYMGTSALETYEDPKTGEIRSPTIGATLCYPEEENWEGVDEEERERQKKELEEEREEQRKRIDIDAVRGANILHNFKKDKDWFRLPDFDGHDYALHDTHLFWRRLPQS